MAKGDTTFELRIARGDKNLLVAAAKQLGVSASELVREGAIGYARGVLGLLQSSDGSDG